MAQSVKCFIIWHLLMWVTLLVADNPPPSSRELIFLSFLPENHVQHKEVNKKWAKTIEKETNGKLNVTILSPEKSGPIKNYCRNVLNNKAQLLFGVHAYYPEEYPLATVMRLPFHMTDAKTASLVAWDLHKTHLQEEFKNFKLLWVFLHGPTHLHTINKPVRTLEDLRGMKIRVAGKIMAATIRKLGGIPIVLPLADTYAALQDGSIDGLLAPWELMLPFKFNERCKYHTEIGINATSFFVAMNNQVFESLPPAEQAVITRNSGEWMSAKAGAAFDNEDRRCRNIIEKQGGIILNLSDAERERWKEKAMPIGDEWLEQMQRKNLPGKDVLTYVVRLWSYLK